MPRVCSLYQNCRAIFGLTSHRQLELISAVKNHTKDFNSCGAPALGNAVVRVSAASNGTPNGGTDITNNSSGARWHCEYCDREFDTNIGLGQHKRWMHREELNEERQLASTSQRSSNNDDRVRNTISSRCRWTLPEITSLALLDLELRLANPDMSEAALNTELAKKLPGRSADAIKGQKKGLPFKTAAANAKKAMEERESEPNHAVTDTTVTPASQTTPDDGEIEVVIYNGQEADQTGASLERVNVEASVSETVVPEAQSSLPDLPSEQTDEANGPSVGTANMSQSGETRLNYVDYQMLEKLRTDALLYAKRIRTTKSFGVKHLIYTLRMPRGSPNVLPRLEAWLDKVLVMEDRLGGNRRNSKRRQPQRNIRRGYGDGRNLRGKERLTEKVYLQKLYERRGLKGVAQHVLRTDDLGDAANIPINPDEMLNFWKDIFGSDIYSDNAVPTTTVEDSVPNATWEVITQDDIKRTELTGKTASGPDGISANLWKAIPRSVRALFYNVILFHGIVVPRLAEARTIFIPKVKNPKHPGEFRPISITSVIQRQLHRIFVKRLNAVLKFDSRQQAFRNGVDGVSNNLATLRTLIECSARARRELHIVSLDARKAFDMIIHNAIFQTLSDLELPTGFINYLKRLYSSAFTNLELGNGVSTKIRIGRGVFQGDPLSPIIFNHVIDRTLKKLHEDLGYPCGADRVTAMAFADDIAIIGESESGTQININRMVNNLGKLGLSLNPEKCLSLSIKKNGHQKTSCLDTSNPFSIGSDKIKSITPTTKWTYLGIHLTGAKIDVQLPDIRPKLDRVKNALLKPQQKLEMINQIIIPAVFHQAILGNATQEELNSIDIQVRKTVREIMHLPHDVPKSYIHAPVRCGGMGVPELLIRIPTLRYKRLRKFADSGSGLAPEFDRSIAYRHNKQKFEDFMLENELVYGDTGKDLMDKYYIQCLNRNYATRGLTESYHSRQTRAWCNSRSNEISGGDFIKYHLISSCSLPTLARRAWGRQGSMDVQCRQGCSTAETAHHVLQECTRTHGGRVLRHDRALAMIHSMFQRKCRDSITVEKEPHIQTSSGLRKPDLLLHGNNEAVVIDLNIVGRENMSESRSMKVAKYCDLPGLTGIIKNRYNVKKVSYEAITISYCGVIERVSREMLRVMRFTGADIFRITTSVLRGSWLNWFQFKKTHQQRFFDPKT